MSSGQLSAKVLVIDTEKSLLTCRQLSKLRYQWAVVWACVENVSSQGLADLTWTSTGNTPQYSVDTISWKEHYHVFAHAQEFHFLTGG